MNQDKNIIARRPAETGGAAGASVMVIARAFGVKDPNILAGIGAAVGVGPGVITWIVATVRRSG